MPQVNLSTLSAPELRRLLDATRARGDATLSYQILQEMAARRESRESRGRQGPLAMRWPARQRVVAVDLGDPMEPKDDVPPAPAWYGLPPKSELEAEASASPPPAPAPRRSRQKKTQPAPTVAAALVAAVDVEPERGVRVADPEPPEDAAADLHAESLRLHPPEPQSLRAPRRLGRGPVAGFAVGIAVGVALGWWVAGLTRETPSLPAAQPAAPIQTAALSPRPAPAPAAVVPPAPEPAPAALAVAVEPPPLDVVEAPVSPPAAGEVVRAQGEALELPQPPPARGTAEGANACTAEPAPADRTICGDPELRRLQRELRQAYAEALEAHQDRALLRQRQLAWRDARNTVSDPERLGWLYEERIRKLNAATAAARQQR